MAELKWKARWISYGQHPNDDLGVFVFRRRFEWSGSGPMPIKVSADQRYQLRVNGHFVGEGPQRGDLQHWFYESYDFAPFLEPGENEIEATVWSFGRYAPMAQLTYRLAFVLEGQGISTPDGWEVARVEGHDFEMMHNEVGGFYIDIGPGEAITVPSKERSWRKPNTIVHVLERGEFAGDSPWFVVPRAIPAMTRAPWKGGQRVVDRETNDRKPFDTLMIHPGEKVLLDFGELLTAYPEFGFQGDQGTTVKVTYGEGLFDKNGSKNHREDVRGKQIKGYQDRFTIGANLGSKAAEFRTVWWRTWRYLQLESDKPVRLVALNPHVTGYPYTVESSFTGSDPWIEKIWDVGVRTAKLCAGETYFDCPYYEQLQYVGDTRIQALLHYYLSRDRRLARNAIDQFGWSIQPDGLTMSRYPTRVQQIIPGFSLIWSMMLVDSLHYDDAPTDWADRSNDCQRVCEAVRKRWTSPGVPEHWWFLDWADNWNAGIPPNSWKNSAFELLEELALTCAQILKAGGKSHDRLQVDRESGLITKIRRGDGPWTSSPPQEHTEALWRCLQFLNGQKPDPWPANELENAKATKCTYYFQYYKHQAMQPDDYLAELEPWKEMIRNGLTTFAEAPEPTRSDCHAWSAHPLIGFFQLIAGVTSTAPGWKSAKIAPKPGQLSEFHAKIAHPRGDLTVAWKEGRFHIDSPVPYQFVWKGKSVEAKAGKATY